MKVTSQIERGIVTVTVEYGYDFFSDRKAKQKLSEKMRDAYQKEADTKEPRLKDCIIILKAELASSEIVHALYELWKEVYHNDGTLYCVDYPQDYIESIFSLGLAGQPRFELGAGVDDALAKLTA